MGFLLNALITVVIATGIMIFGSALIEAGRRRGFDPISGIAKFLSPTDSRTQTDALAANAGA